MSLTKEELNALPEGSIIRPVPSQSYTNWLTVALKISNHTSWVVTGYGHLVPTHMLHRFADEWEKVNVS